MTIILKFIEKKSTRVDEHPNLEFEKNDATNDEIEAECLEDEKWENSFDKLREELFGKKSGSMPKSGWGV